MRKVDCIIIGSGPAGYTAGIYAARANLKTVLFTGGQPGCQLTTTTDVYNYPGYPEGVDGTSMMEDLQEQAQRMGCDIIHDTIIKVTEVNNTPDKEFILETEGHIEIVCKALIVATGASAKWMGLPSEEAFKTKGVSACATCDGFFYKGMNVCVIGGGDTACEEALYLANFCKDVKLLVRKDKMKASKVMQDRVFKKENIQIIWNTELQEVIGDDVVRSIKMFNNSTNKTTEILMDGVFIAIGHTPNSDLFKGILELDGHGYIRTVPGTTITSVSGIFAAGDVQDSIYRQAVTSAGTGCMAALDAERYLGALNN